MSEPQRPVQPNTGDDTEKCFDDELFVKIPDFSSKRTIPLSMEYGYDSDSFSDEEESDEGVPCLPYNAEGHRLFNFLQYLTAHRWMWCEFFESLVDKPILADAYDVNRFMCDFYPQIATRQLSRHGWQLIRRIMGKARRFSSAFVDQERLELERGRRIIRDLQLGTFNNKLIDEDYYDLIPRRIPMPLTIGCKVTSLIDKKIPPGKNQLVTSRYGLRDGLLVGHEPHENSYFVEFSFEGKSKVINVPDYAICPILEPKSLDVSTIIMEIDTEQNKTVTTYEPKQNYCQNYPNSPYSKCLLESVLQLKSILKIKKKTVQDIASINQEFEFSNFGNSTRSLSTIASSKSTGQRDDIQRRYASLMIALHRINAEIQEPLQIARAFVYRFNNSLQAQYLQCLSQSQLYQQARTFAELDMKTAEKNSAMPLGIQGTRELLLNIQTIFYLCGQLGDYYNQVNIEAVLNDVVTYVLATLPSVLSVPFKKVIHLVEALCSRLAAQQQADQLMEDNLMHSFELPINYQDAEDNLMHSFELPINYQDAEELEELEQLEELYQMHLLQQLQENNEAETS
ncbi:protein lin-9 homolog [Drosophila tropicalis]|uniref:protein lin-9 homolog n=1 Tax=Drosophila tropicalis TaxID=46794 RepID=UPI0035ABC53C